MARTTNDRLIVSSPYGEFHASELQALSRTLKRFTGTYLAPFIG